MSLDERDFFANPFTEAEILALLAGRPPSDLFSWKSPSAKGLGVTPDTDPARLVQLMLAEPRLIRRPITRIGGRLILGADYAALEEAVA
ncbi:MAG: hypothetical protein HY681_08940 [Chloroflexi bacterium]|nr:hypothetical protein [Chloroflexota bacterium]